jgi:hypothetical protein
MMGNLVGRRPAQNHLITNIGLPSAFMTAVGSRLGIPRFICLGNPVRALLCWMSALTVGTKGYLCQSLFGRWGRQTFTTLSFIAFVATPGTGSLTDVVEWHSLVSERFLLPRVSLTICKAEQLTTVCRSQCLASSDSVAVLPQAIAPFFVISDWTLSSFDEPKGV